MKTVALAFTAVSDRPPPWGQMLIVAIQRGNAPVRGTGIMCAMAVTLGDARPAYWCSSSGPKAVIEPGDLWAELPPVSAVIP